ncbi:MAG: helix-turn-helix transcriptional regulator [Gammaproteobacteria bacterium]|nr:helix-turn-helix transcriptional regulator [Gammaproteobacteria bacterium]
MGQTTALVQTLKRCLKEQGITYAQLCKPLDLSEASVKRLFAEESFSIKRLDKICGYLGMTLGDLITKMELQQEYLSELTEAQEHALVKDERLILVMQLVFSDWTYKDILRIFTLSEPELIQYLVQLDKLGLIELLPKNRIKLLTAHNFTWRKHGPVQSFFRQNLQSDYFDSNFDQDGSNLTMLTGMLSADARAEFDKKLNEFAKEFDQLCKSDSKRPLTERLGYGVVLAIRPWKLSFFSKYIKD